MYTPSHGYTHPFIMTSGSGDWEAMLAGENQHPDVVLDDIGISTGLIDPDDFHEVEEEGADLDDLPLPDVIPTTRDLLDTLQKVEQQEEAIESARPRDSDEGLPDMPEETMSVVAEVQKHHTDIESLVNRMTKFEEHLAAIRKLTSSYEKVENTTLDNSVAVSALNESVLSIRRELSSLSNNLTAAMAASERKILAAVKSSGTVADSIIVEATEPPSEIITPGVLTVDTQVKTDSKPVLQKARRVVIPDW
jgi:myosin heavy subunit